MTVPKTATHSNPMTCVWPVKARSLRLITISYTNRPKSCSRLCLFEFWNKKLSLPIPSRGAIIRVRNMNTPTLTIHYRYSTTKNFFIARFNPQKDFFRREYVISFWREELKDSVDGFNEAVCSISCNSSFRDEVYPLFKIQRL